MFNSEDGSSCRTTSPRGRGEPQHGRGGHPGKVSHLGCHWATSLNLRCCSRPQGKIMLLQPSFPPSPHGGTALAPLKIFPSHEEGTKGTHKGKQNPQDKSTIPRKCKNKVLLTLEGLIGTNNETWMRYHTIN